MWKPGDTCGTCRWFFDGGCYRYPPMTLFNLPSIGFCGEYVGKFKEPEKQQEPISETIAKVIAWTNPPEIKDETEKQPQESTNEIMAKVKAWEKQPENVNQEKKS